MKTKHHSKINSTTSLFRVRQLQEFLLTKECLIIFATALAVRALFLFQWRETPFSWQLQADAKYFDEWAQRIVNGEWVPQRVFYQSPVYAYFLAAVYKLFGHHLIAVQAIQVFAGSVSSALFYVFGALVFSPSVGLVAGFLAALYRPFIFNDSMILKSTWDIFFTFLFLGFAMRTAHTKGKIDALFTGLFFGISILLRGNMILLTPVIPIWWRLSDRATPFKHYLLLGVVYISGIFITISPVTGSNYFLGKDKVLVTYTGGATFWLGNNSSADGLLSYPPGFDPHYLSKDEEGYYYQLAESGSGKNLKPSEVSKFWSDKAKKDIRSNPAGWIKLLFKKFIYFWNYYEFPDNYSMDFIQKEFPTILNFPLISFKIIAPLSILGAILSWSAVKMSRLLTVLAAGYIFSVILFIVTDRFRLPILVYLIPLSAYAAARMFTGFFQRKKQAILFLVAALPILLLLCWLPIYKPDFHTSYGSLAEIYAKQKNFDQAVHYYEKAINLNPGFTDACINLSLLYDQLNNSERAIFYGQKAVELSPALIKAYHHLGNLYYKKNNYDLAFKYYKKTIELDPLYGDGYNNIGSVLVTKKQYRDAILFFQKAIELNPADTDARDNLDSLKKTMLTFR